MASDLRRLCAVLSAIACLSLPPMALAEDAITPEEACEQFPQAARADCLAGAALLMDGSSEPDVALTVRVVASAGKLNYQYELNVPNENGSADFQECTTADMLTLPIGTRVRLLLTAQDGVYTWRIPPLDVGVDLVPGRINEVMLEPVANDTVIEGRLLDEQSGIESGTKIRITDKVQETTGRLSLEALCGD
jgi:heme/copper-type cytochrome/quinol oxidase subunit 2